MANYANLLAQIAANIYSNNNQDITGDGLQAQLNAMVASLGAGYQFMGVAHPSDTPSGYSDLRAFWLASEAGTYTNFGGLVVNDGEVCALCWNGAWTKKISGAAPAAQVSELAQELNEMIKENLKADFSISDLNGMAIVQFKGGGINTKNFDSAKTPKQDDMDNGDLDISDEQGNVLARFKDGHIQTKKFNSADIPELGVVIGRYDGKRISILGDSISTFGDPSATNQNGTYCYSYYPAASCRYSRDGVDSIPFDVNNTYWMKLISATRMVLGINDSYRGTRVSGTSNAFNLQSRINHLGENGTPDIILVYGGTNDAGGAVTIGTFNTENPENYTAEQIAALPVTTFADAYRTMLIRLMKTYPFAEIVVILPTFTTSYYTITNLDLYVEIIKEACDFFGIKYIDARCSGINVYNKASYLVDGIHPNIAGMNLLFEKIYRQLIFN